MQFIHVMPKLNFQQPLLQSFQFHASILNKSITFSKKINSLLALHFWTIVCLHSDFICSWPLPLCCPDMIRCWWDIHRHLLSIPVCKHNCPYCSFHVLLLQTKMKSHKPGNVTVTTHQSMSATNTTLSYDCIACLSFISQTKYGIYSNWKILSLTITEKSTKSLALRFVILAEIPFELVWVIAHTDPTHAVSSSWARLCLPGFDADGRVYGDPCWTVTERA